MNDDTTKKLFDNIRRIWKALDSKEDSFRDGLEKVEAEVSNCNKGLRHIHARLDTVFYSDGLKPAGGYGDDVLAMAEKYTAEAAERLHNRMLVFENRVSTLESKYAEWHKNCQDMARMRNQLITEEQKRVNYLTERINQLEETLEHVQYRQDQDQPAYEDEVRNRVMDLQYTVNRLTRTLDEKEKATAATEFVDADDQVEMGEEDWNNNNME